MVLRLIIVGGGTAGWLSAAYLARMLGASVPGGAAITLVESADIPILGVGEGTFPSLQTILARIGADEADFMRQCHATFKQGILFEGWRYEPGHVGRNHYLHPFASAPARQGLDLLPYWLLGCAGEGVELDEATTLQKAVADAKRAPKRVTDHDFDGPLSYAYHFDAAALAAFLATHAVRLGVKRVVATVQDVKLDDRGHITSVGTREHGEIEGDLFIDCTGFNALLIGKTLGVEYKSVRRWLFCDRAVAMQVPYDQPDHQIASYTVSTAKEAGWVWDIGLDSRRGTGYVYSSDHTADDRAEKVLRDYNGDAGRDLPVRTFRFDPGYRETTWVGNCIAVGLSGAFFEPLEATGIVLIEVAVKLLALLYPWDGRIETAARQFNRVMKARYEQVLDFIKMHYCLSERRDTAFWRENTMPGGITQTLEELFDRWRTRPPSELDFDLNVATFHHDSWKYVMYGMGFKTDLSAKAPIFRHFDAAREEFTRIRKHAADAVRALPSHRDLITEIYNHGYNRQRFDEMNFAIARR